MNNPHHNHDVLVIGGGPAGLAAAVCARQTGARVAIVDDNPGLGGQIWRGEQRKTTTPESAEWLKRVQAAQVEFISGARVYDQPEAGLLLAETFDGVLELSYRKLILATGARERFLPFPGWTLPGVAGAGGLQALVKSGLPIEGKKVVVAGTGPLLLAVAAYLRKRGAEVLLIAEQAPLKSLLSFGLGLSRSPGKIVQAIQLKRELAGIPHLTGCWPVAANAARPEDLGCCLRLSGLRISSGAQHGTGCLLRLRAARRRCASRRLSTDDHPGRLLRRRVHRHRRVGSLVSGRPDCRLGCDRPTGEGARAVCRTSGLLLCAKS
jgi:hypothetical protein